MGVKSKLKRRNKEILRLKKELEEKTAIILAGAKKVKQLENKEEQLSGYTRQLENIVKFVVTNHIGDLQGGMEIEKYGIDKMQRLRLSIDYQPICHSYIIRVNY